MRARQVPAVISMISGTPVLNTSDEGRITPMDFFVPSASITVCDTHLPSKKTLDFLMTETLSNCLLMFYSFVFCPGFTLHA